MVQCFTCVCYKSRKQNKVSRNLVEVNKLGLLLKDTGIWGEDQSHIQGENYGPSFYQGQT